MLLECPAAHGKEYAIAEQSACQAAKWKLEGLVAITFWKYYIIFSGSFLREASRAVEYRMSGRAEFLALLAKSETEQTLH